MNRVKATSSLLLLASMLGATAPLHADFGTELLPQMFGSDSASTIAHAHKLPLREQVALREALVKKYGKEVNKLLPLHSENPQDLMSFLAPVGKDIKKTELFRGVGRQAALMFGTMATGVGALATLDYEGRTSGNLGFATLGLLALSGINFVGLLGKQGVLNGLRKLPAVDVASKGFFELRGMRQTIATDLANELGRFFINNRKFIDRAALALTIEKAYSKKQMQVAAIGGAVLLGAAVLYLAASAVRRNTKAAAATIGTGALGGLAALLSLSPLATPVINERLKGLQKSYRDLRAQVQQGK